MTEAPGPQQATTVPTLAQVILDAIEYRLGDLHVGMPGRVEAFYPAAQQADVQPLLKRVVVAPDGTKTIDSFPKLVNVPVEFPRGGGWRITWPLAAGDIVEIRFMERSMDAWSGSGGEVEPQQSRRHHLSDAICFPALSPARSAIPGIGSTDLIIGREDGTSEIRMKPDGSILLGQTPSLGVARTTDPVQITQITDPAFFAWLATVATAVSAKLPPTPGAPPPYTAPINGQITGGSAKVKAGA